MLDNGNIFNPSRQVPLILAGETDELYVILKDLIDSTPELKSRIEQTKAEVEAEFETLKAVWTQFKDIENQKEFALSILPKSRFSSLLFQLRKLHGKTQTLDHLKAMWRESADLIVKVLYA